MRENSSRFRFSLKTLLVIPIVVLIALIWINIKFRQKVSSTKVGFGTTLNGLYGAADAHGQLEAWLTSIGYKHTHPPSSGSRYIGHRESWYAGVCDDVEHYVYIRSNSSYFGADVHYETQKWMFETNDDEKSGSDAVVGKIASWWDENESILTSQAPRE